MKAIFSTLLVLLTINTRSQNVGIGTTSPQHKLHVEGTVFVNSAVGSFKLGYPGLPANFWEFSTINGGADIRIKSNSVGGTVRYPYWFGQSGRLGINLDTLPNVEAQYALHVAARNKYAIYGTTKQFGTDTVAGVVGFANSPTPVPFSAGVRGESNSTNYNGIGVIGIQRGSGWGVAGFAKENSFLDYGAGVFGAIGLNVTGNGIGGYGVLGHNYNSEGYAGAFKNLAPSNGGALQTMGKVTLSGIGEGVNKVLTSDASGNATWQRLPAFVHKATDANSTGHVTDLSYTNPLQTDIVMVTPNYNPSGGPSAYNNHPIGVFWNGNTWTIFNQDLAAISGTSYNVMVVRQ
jgi:hypothetical protein